MEKKTNTFLESEPVGKLMFRYAAPCIISLLVGALYNIVDQLYIANASYLGSYGNAANTVVYPLTVVALSIACMIGDGCCSYVSISLGSNQPKNAAKSVANAVRLCLTVGILLAAVYLVFSDPILTLFGGHINEETYACAKEYFFYISLGIPFYMFAQSSNPIIVSDGSPRYALVTSLTGSLINIILDPILIFACRWGMAGAAIATIAGQIVTAGLNAWRLCHMKAVPLKKDDFKFSIDILKRFVSLGFCSFLAQISIVLSMAFVQNMVVKYGALDEVFSQAEYAQIPMAVIGIVMKVFQIVISVAIGLAAGCTPIVGYNYGARQYQRTKSLMLRLISIEALIGLTATVLVELLPYQIMSLFGASGESVYYTRFGVKALRIYLCLTTLACVNKGASIFIQSIGKAWLATLLPLLREIVFGIGFVVVLPAFFGLDGILYFMPVSDLLTGVISAGILLRTGRKLNSQSDADFQSVEDAQEMASDIFATKQGLIITISREHGTQGKKIGEAVADQLRVPYYYKQTTALAAQESGLSKEFIADLDVNSQNVVHELYLTTNSLVETAIRAQSDILNRIADAGACVIVGRAADYVLKNRENIFKVFLYADDEYRIRNVMEMYGDTREEAKKSIARSDHARGNYYHSISGLQWGYRHNYDLCVNCSFGAEEAIRLILEAVKLRERDMKEQPDHSAQSREAASN